MFNNPLDGTVAHLAPLVRLPSAALYRLPPPIPIKDLGAPLSANQVVIRAAKIRGLINKGLSLLAIGSLCLNRWHRSAFWAHRIDARTPGVPWNGEQRQSLALDNNAGIGGSLPIFRGTLRALVFQSPQSFFFPSWWAFSTRQLAELHKHRDSKPLFSSITQKVKLLHWERCIKKQAQQTLLSSIPNQHTLCYPIIASRRPMANLTLCPISLLQSNCSPSLEIASHQSSGSPVTPNHQNPRPRLIFPAPSSAWHVPSLTHDSPTTRCAPHYLSLSAHTSSHLAYTYIPSHKNCDVNIRVHLSLCGSFPSLWFSVHQGGVDLRSLVYLLVSFIYLSLSHPLCCSGLSTALIPYQPAGHPSRCCLSRQIHHPPICLTLPMLGDDLLGKPHRRFTQGGGDSVAGEN